VVVDTDVVSYLFKRDSRADAYRLHLTGRLLVVSFMTVAELDRWALECDWGETRRIRMERYLRNFVVHPFDRALCLRWAEATDGARRKGRPIGVADACGAPRPPFTTAYRSSPTTQTTALASRA
jgi:tRNA(fMet)-specific endonuclease VapC